MLLEVVLLLGEKLFYSNIRIGDTVSFGSGKKDNVFIEEFVPNQIVIKWKNQGLEVKVQKPFDKSFDSLPLDSIAILDEDRQVAIFATSLVSEPFLTYKIPYNCKFTVGRAQDNDFVVSLPYFSNTHFTIKSEAGHLRVEDNDSTNGIYLNGRLVSIARIKSGDILSVLGVHFHFINGEMFIENCGNKLLVNLKNDEVYLSKIIKDGIHAPHYRRSPRTREKLPTEDIILSSAPTKGQRHEHRRMMGASLLGTGAMVASSLVVGAVSPALLAARAASLVSPIASMASSGRMNKKQDRKYNEYEEARRVKYGAYIEEQKARIEAVAQVQHDILNKENPSPKECLEIVSDLKRGLWSRMDSDSDFLNVRIGMGYENLCVQVKSRSDADGFKMEDDEIEELSNQIIEETRIVDEIPLRVSLIDNQTVGIIGNRDRVISLVRNMIISISSLHCFTDVKLIGIFDEKESSEWAQLKWLPHIWNDRRTARFLAFGDEQTRDVCEMLGGVIKNREENDDKGSAKPHYIVVIGSKELIEREPVLAKLVKNNPDIGITSLFLFDDMYSLPNSCEYIIDLDNGPCAYHKDEYNSRAYFTEDSLIDKNTFNSFARGISAIELDGYASTEDLPDGVTFLQGYGVKRVEDLDILNRWRKSKPYKTLSAPIGALSAGKTFKFDIIDSSTNSTAHGPHGLVAGTTGSGKSELLQTWILSVACNYHPYDVAFVIIDYKGGGMANILSPLPHVVGTITNIDSDISRALASLKSEVSRRERIFSENKVNKIDKYIEMYHEGKVSEPLPHLIIVADEFAELKHEEPTFIPTIIQIARVGRSLGIHLVLATQKPSGVVDDQIWSNSQFQICLKVQNEGDSREMIKRPDAAWLTQAGRAYCNTTVAFDLLQSYWSGAPYQNGVNDVDNDCKVSIVDFSGTRIKTVVREKRKKDGIDEITAITQYIADVAKQMGISKLQGPWLSELPTEISIQDVSKPSFDGKKWQQEIPWLKVPIGLYDLPNNQEQGVQYLDFASEGHFGIYGASATGKSTLVKTIIMSICMNYSPKDVNIYVLDAGGWGTNIFADMPHVGGIALDGEDEKFEKFSILIEKEIAKRKQLFMKNAVSSLAKYRENVSDDIPAIIIVIDNITPILEMYPVVETLLITIAAQGPTYGVHIVFTANSTTGAKYKIVQNIKGAIAFEMADKSDYAGIVGRVDGNYPKQPGRALIKNNPPIIFQTAMYERGKNEREKNQNIRELSDYMNQVWQGKRPARIPLMPEVVHENDVKASYIEPDLIPIGIDYENVEVSFANLTNAFGFMITGHQTTGKSKLLAYMTECIIAKEQKIQLYIMDSDTSPLSSFKDKAVRYTNWKDVDAVDDYVDEIIRELEVRFETEDKTRGLILLVVDDLIPFIKAISDQARDRLVLICRKAIGCGIRILVSANQKEVMSLYSTEPLTAALVNFQNGICIGGTLNEYSYAKSSLKYEQKSIEMGKDDAYMFYDGEAYKIKLVR